MIYYTLEKSIILSVLASMRSDCPRFVLPPYLLYTITISFINPTIQECEYIVDSFSRSSISVSQSYLLIHSCKVYWGKIHIWEWIFNHKLYLRSKQWLPPLAKMFILLTTTFNSSVSLINKMKVHSFANR